MRDVLEKMISGGRAIIYDNKIVITTSFARARDIFKTELLNLSAFLKTYNIRCGISRRCMQPAELRFYYRQALDAMRIGTHMDYDRYIYPYGEYAVYHIAQVCVDKRRRQAVLSSGAGGPYSSRWRIRHPFYRQPVYVHT